MSEENTNRSGGFKGKMMIVVAVIAIVFTFFMMIMKRGGSGSSSLDGCNANPQSPWGQSQESVWVDLSSHAENKAVARFDFSYPETPLAEYPNANYRAYTYLIFEVYWTDDAGNEGVRFSKAHTCNGVEVYDVGDQYDNKITHDVGEYKVVEYGNGDTVSAAYWVRGEYTYTILCAYNPMTSEEIEAWIPLLD